MKKWRRRIGAAFRMGLTWAIAWFGAGMVLLLVGLVFGATADVPFPLAFGLFGFIAGTTFSGVLSVGEGHRRFDQMSMPRFAGWGTVGGLLLSVVFVSATALGGDTTPLENLEVLVPVFALAGAGSAASVLALARRAEEGGRLDGGADLAEGDLMGNESQKLIDKRD